MSSFKSEDPRSREPVAPEEEKQDISPLKVAILLFPNMIPHTFFQPLSVFSCLGTKESLDPDFTINIICEEEGSIKIHNHLEIRSTQYIKDWNKQSFDIVVIPDTFAPDEEIPSSQLQDWFIKMSLEARWILLMGSSVLLFAQSELLNGLEIATSAIARTVLPITSPEIILKDGPIIYSGKYVTTDEKYLSPLWASLRIVALEIGETNASKRKEQLGVD